MDEALLTPDDKRKMVLNALRQLEAARFNAEINLAANLDKNAKADLAHEVNLFSLRIEAVRKEFAALLDSES